MKKIIKDIKGRETGAISTLVLFTVLMFMIILMGIYFVITTMQKSQLKSDIRIQEIYGHDVNKIDEIYNQLLTKYAKYDEPYIPDGFTHTEGTWNSGYTIKETSTGNEFVWVPCVLDQNKVKEGDKVQLFKRTLPSTEETTDPYYMYNKNNIKITGDESSASNIRESVGKYGGFYIAKYEAAVPLDENGNEIEVTSATTSQKARSVLGATVWTNISREDALIVAENMINTTDGVISGLISGECWDTTLQWIVKTSENSKNEPNAGYDINSVGNGWYSDVSNSKKTKTGYKAVNNIYDMAGNVWDWTTENATSNGSNSFISRGGCYINSGKDMPAAYRATAISMASDYIGFRVVLYK